MKSLIASILVLISTFSFVQAKNDTCNCPEVFEEVVLKVDENYLPLKLDGTGINKKAYQNRIEKHRSSIQNVDASQCAAAIQEFLSFFDDKHLFVFEQPKYTDSELEEIKSTIKAERKSTSEIIDEVSKYRGKEKLVGFYWDGNSILAIQAIDNKLEARIINSAKESASPGELKATFKATPNGYSATYYGYNYSARYIEGGLYKQDSLLCLSGGICWQKIGRNELKSAFDSFADPSLPTFKDLGNGTTLFSIPSFNADYQKFMTVIRENTPLHKKTENLIFDIRGNTGGNAVYFSFISAYAKQNLRSSQGKLLASAPTLTYFERLAKNTPEIYQPVVDRIRGNMGQVVDGPAYPERAYKASEDFRIKRVAILTDQGCMSASESFIIHSKAVNPEVQTFGQATAGVIDYTSVNAIPLASGGSRNIYFGYPTSSLHMDIPKNGFNKTGIVPDVAIPSQVEDPIQFIVDFWNN